MNAYITTHVKSNLIVLVSVNNDSKLFFKKNNYLSESILFINFNTHALILIHLRDSTEDLIYMYIYMAFKNYK